MSALTANLKALLRPGFMLNAGYLFLVSIAMFFWIPGNPSDSTSELKSYGFGLIFPWIQGLFTGMMVLEIMTKPFGFGLPGYSLVIRRMLFILGLGFSALPALLFLFYPELSTGGYVRVILAAFCMGLMCFWLGVAFSFHRTIFSLICIGFVVYLTFSDGFVVLNRFTQRAIVNNSWATIAIGLIVCGIAWVVFGREDILRAYARRNWGRFPSSIDKTGRWRYSREKNGQLPIRPGWISVRLERFFLRRMNSCKKSGLARFIWGQLYIVLAPSAWSVLNEGLLWIGIPLLIFAFGFAGGEIAMILCFIWMLHVKTTIPAYSSLIHVGGRREKWIATMLCAAVISILVTALIVGFALLTIPLWQIIPSFVIQNDRWTYQPVSLRFWYGPLFIIPLTYTLNMVFPNMPFLLRFFGVWVLIAGTVCVISFTDGLSGFSEPFLATALTCVSWLILLVVSWHVCTKWSLVRT